MRHESTLIAPKTWLISEYRLVNTFLLEGEEQALLLDTGDGIGDLAQDVCALTKKPLIVANTHGHVDHAGGNGAFAQVLLHPRDWELSHSGCDYETRLWFAQTRAPIRNPACAAELVKMVQPDRDYTRLPLQDGQHIDLGGRVLEVIATPGHTHGSVCFLDAANRLLFTGDMANDCLLLNCGSEVSATVREYHDSMRRLWERREEYDHLVRGHEEPAVVDREIISRYLAATHKLLDGSAVGQRSSSAIRNGVVYFENGLEIWYDPDRLEQR